MNHEVMRGFVRSLGAGLKDEINNPLQEITAMVSLVELRCLNEDEQKEALKVIGKAANDIAQTMNGFEERALNDVLVAFENEDDFRDSFPRFDSVSHDIPGEPE